MHRWRFLTNHALVLDFIATHPRGTTREIASAVGITERAVYKIIRDLEAEGYIVKNKIGRQNTYLVNTTLPLRDPAVEDTVIGDLLAVLRGRKSPRRIAPRPARMRADRPPSSAQQYP